jgi:thioredoxin 1
MALAITDATFEEVVLKSDKPVMVDFWQHGVNGWTNH